MSIENILKEEMDSSPTTVPVVGEVIDSDLFEKLFNTETSGNETAWSCEAKSIEDTWGFESLARDEVFGLCVNPLDAEGKCDLLEDFDLLQYVNDDHSIEESNKPLEDPCLEPEPIANNQQTPLESAPKRSKRPFHQPISSSKTKRVQKDSPQSKDSYLSNYGRMRTLNNEASKRCRLKRKLKMEQLLKEEQELKVKNEQLKIKHQKLKELVDKFKSDFLKRISDS